MIDQKSLVKNLTASAKNIAALSESSTVIEAITRSVGIIVESYVKGGCLYVAGNGGSAADAQHIVAELISKLDKNRTPIKAFALSVDTSILTAIGNDYGYEYSFSRQLEAVLKPEDVFLAITTSGNSKNIIKGLEVSKKKGTKSILLSGRDGGLCKSNADVSILVPGQSTAEIQEAHIVVYHNLCWLIEGALVEKGICQYV